MKMKWKLSSFEQLSVKELYSILQLRQEVFIVEQQCLYRDCDGLDQKAHHLVGYLENDTQVQSVTLVAYLRLFLPEEGKRESRVGRLLVHPNFRNKGLARKTMTIGLSHIEKLAPKTHIIISAQQYLIEFYQSLNFQISSDTYDEDGIAHLKMIHPPLNNF